MKPSWILRCASLAAFGAGLAAACGGGGDTTATSTTSGPDTSTGPTTTVSSSGTGGGGNSIGGDITMDTTISGDVSMNDTVTVKQGATLTIAAGTTIHATQGSKILVAGKLVVAGTSSMGVTFQSQLHSGSGTWIGIEVQSGGDAKIDYALMHDANLSFQADSGSTYAIDHFESDTSNQVMSLDATGTIGHAKLHSDGGEGVIIGDNTQASPTFTDTLFDKGGGKNGSYLIRVRDDNAAPTFDHCEMTDAQIGLRIERGKNIVVSNSSIHDAGLGIEVNDATGVKVDTTNFEKNDANIGNCGAGDITATGCYFDTTAFDKTCMAQMNDTPAMAALNNVGPRP